MDKITVSASIPVKEVRALFRKVFKIKKTILAHRLKFEELLKDPKFLELLGNDLFKCWRIMNDEMDGPNGRGGYDAVQEIYTDLFKKYGFKAK